jgi:hypothetical protein
MATGGGQGFPTDPRLVPSNGVPQHSQSGCSRFSTAMGASHCHPAIGYQRGKDGLLVGRQSITRAPEDAFTDKQDRIVMPLGSTCLGWLELIDKSSESKIICHFSLPSPDQSLPTKLFITPIENGPPS